MSTDAPMSHRTWSADLTLCCERLAQRLHRAGAPHPLEAAVALAVRGVRGLSVEGFAVELGLDPDHLRTIEDGQLAFPDLPPSLLDAARHTQGLDLDRLASKRPARR